MTPQHADPEKALVSFLEDRSRAVRALEADAEKTLHTDKDEPGYRGLMRQKAELLKALAADAEPLLEALPEQARERIEPTVRAFSQSAAMSLRIDSVFFMSALLYPDEHKKGEPDNLELFIASLKGAS